MILAGPKHWDVRGYDDAQAHALAAATGLSPIGAGLLIARDTVRCVEKKELP